MSADLEAKFTELLLTRIYLIEEAEAVNRRLHKIDADLANLAAAARIFEVDLKAPVQRREAYGTVQSAIVALLKEAGPNGTTAAAIAERLNQQRSTPLHHKTVGMTLNRLKRNGLANRVGTRTWLAP